MRVLEVEAFAAFSSIFLVLLSPNKIHVCPRAGNARYLLHQKIIHLNGII